MFKNRLMFTGILMAGLLQVTAQTAGPAASTETKPKYDQHALFGPLFYPLQVMNTGLLQENLDMLIGKTKQIIKLLLH